MTNRELKKAYEQLRKAELELKKKLENGEDMVPKKSTGRKLFRIMDKGINVLLKHYGIPTDIDPDEKFDKMYRYDKILAQHYRRLVGIFLDPYAKYGFTDSYLTKIQTIKALFRRVENLLATEKV